MAKGPSLGFDFARANSTFDTQGHRIYSRDLGLGAGLWQPRHRGGNGGMLPGLRGGGGGGGYRGCGYRVHLTLFKHD